MVIYAVRVTIEMGKDHWVEKTVEMLILRRVASASQLYRIVGIPRQIAEDEFISKVSSFADTGVFSSMKISNSVYFLPGITAGLRTGMEVTYPNTKAKLITAALYSELAARIISVEGSWHELPRSEWKLKIGRDVRGYSLAGERRLCIVDPDVEKTRQLLSVMPLTVISHVRQDGGLLQEYVGKKKLVVMHGKELLSDSQ
jgi:hypothetical protein